MAGMEGKMVGDEFGELGRGQISKMLSSSMRDLNCILKARQGRVSEDHKFKDLRLTTETFI